MNLRTRHLSIIQRLALGFAVILLLLLLSVALSLYAGQRLADQVGLLASHTAPTLVQSRAVTRDLFTLDRHLGNALLQTGAPPASRCSNGRPVSTRIWPPWLDR